MTIETPEGTTRIAADAKAGGVTVTNAAGETIARVGTTVPEELPAGLQAYPGAELGSSYSGGENGQRAGAVTMTTEDSLDQVVQFYDKLLAKGNFEVQNRTRSTQGTSEVALLSAKNNQGLTFNLVATQEDGKTQVVLNYSHPE